MTESGHPGPLLKRGQVLQMLYLLCVLRFILTGLFLSALMFIGAADFPALVRVCTDKNPLLLSVKKSVTAVAVQLAGVGDDILDIRTLCGGGLKNNTHDISDEICALTGRIVTRMLSAGHAVTPESLIQALYQLSQTTDNAEIRLDCLELIQQLMTKMH